MTGTITLPLRKVLKNGGMYVVIQYNPHKVEWEAKSKHYAHSTSAYAALGRMTHKDSIK